jgi:glycosyltransferase involved in cell wall biosynthesis
MYDFSILIPLYYAEKTIEHLVEEIDAQFKDKKFQLILVNDGSKDKTHVLCEKLVAGKKNIVYVKLRKNFGEFNAVMCGLSYVKGKYCVIIDDDFQNPPSEIIKLIDKAEEGDFDVVYSQYETKKHNFFRNLGSSITNALISALLKKPKDLYLSSFKLLHHEVIKEIIKYRGPYPYIDGIIFQITDNIGKVNVEHHERKIGESNYTISKLFSLFMTAVLGYSIIPIRILNIVGILALLMSLMHSIFDINRIFKTLPPYSLFKDGIIILAISVIGEYLGKSFLILSEKPQYVVQRAYNANENDD